MHLQKCLSACLVARDCPLRVRERKRLSLGHADACTIKHLFGTYATKGLDGLDRVVGELNLN